jgi:Zn-dependent peptidase ImmA (M78 family)
MLEKFCNDVASEFLVPALELPTLDVNGDMPVEVQAERISDFARERLVSRSMVAYKLFRTNRISHTRWEELVTQFRTDFQAQREARRASARDQPGGPNYYVVRRHRLGAALLRLVDRSVATGILPPTKAGRVLGVNPRSVAPLLSTVHRDVA